MRPIDIISTASKIRISLAHRDCQNKKSRFKLNVADRGGPKLDVTSEAGRKSAVEEGPIFHCENQLRLEPPASFSRLTIAGQLLACRSGGLLPTTCRSRVLVSGSAAFSSHRFGYAYISL